MTQATTPGISGASTGSTSIGEGLSSDATRLKDTATARVEQAADTRKEQATTTAHAISSAIDKAAGALREDDKAPEWLTTAFEKTARQVDELARTIENKDIADIRRSVTGFARQSPVAFLAAAAAAGFAAARFLRAGSEYQTRREQDTQRPFESTGSRSVTKSEGFRGASDRAPVGAAGAASGSDTGGAGSRDGMAGADNTAWAPSSAPLDSEGALS
ncbi:hypothetical protein GCM10011515_06730 [Tsuneonella deserti]|uniref:YtxH-like protein n=1 Tax=Tsuneonella deserti TaxID=2035528 RepID=A0ABQ1S3Q0_9SPHN|nr:hypothetical protein [Tsuneonella deserti]GGD89779.1 hypothetical protein GCM10011515_06730 [Tsuneonella deserti]